SGRAGDGGEGGGYTGDGPGRPADAGEPGGQSLHRARIHGRPDPDVLVTKSPEGVRQIPQPGLIDLDVHPDNDVLGLQPPDGGGGVAKRLDLVLGEVRGDLYPDALGLQAADRGGGVAKRLDLRLRDGGGEIDPDVLGLQPPDGGGRITQLLDLGGRQIDVEPDIDRLVREVPNLLESR